jgi:AbiV family abortive infection protein
MGKRRLDAYCGPLSAAQIAAGMNAAAKNARRLAEDAATLLALGRFPTAASLAILAIEEVGKIPILHGLALATSHVAIARAWKDYRSHTRKNVLWLLPQLVAQGARKLDDLRPLFDEASDHPFLLDQIKQLGFYTDCLGRAHWATPTDLGEELARALVQTARIFAGTDREHTEREVELWIEYMGPVWKKGCAVHEEGLVNWYAAMQRAGLAPRGPNGIEQFIRRGLEEKGSGTRSGVERLPGRKPS